MDSLVSTTGVHSKNHCRIQPFPDERVKHHLFEWQWMMIEKRIDLEKLVPLSE